MPGIPNERNTPSVRGHLQPAPNMIWGHHGEKSWLPHVPQKTFQVFLCFLSLQLTKKSTSFLKRPMDRTWKWNFSFLSLSSHSGNKWPWNSDNRLVTLGLPRTQGQVLLFPDCSWVQQRWGQLRENMQKTTSRQQPGWKSTRSLDSRPTLQLPWPPLGANAHLDRGFWGRHRSRTVNPVSVLARAC